MSTIMNRIIFCLTLIPIGISLAWISHSLEYQSVFSLFTSLVVLSLAVKTLLYNSSR